VELQIIKGKPFYLPVPLIEIFFDLAILAALLYLEQTKLSWNETDKKTSILNPYHGILALLILLSYGTIRFTLEFFREREVIFGGMSFGHIHSLICIAIGVWMFLHRREQYLSALEKNQRHKHPRRR
jgi:prolipoprotein diacylglyceryltransferase